MKYCLGTVQLGMHYGIQGNGQPTSEKASQILSDALANGIDTFDTASAYGTAEEVLGRFIRAHPEQSAGMRLISKLAPDAFSGLPPAQWKTAALARARESLDRLGADRLSAYLFHNAACVFDSRAVAALSAVAEEGLADAVGVSVYTPREAMKALECPQIAVIQVPYNLLDQRLDQCGFFERSAEQGVQVYARSSLLQGLLLMDPEHLPRTVAFAQPYLLRFRALCAWHQVSLLHAAVGFVGAKKEISHVVFGVDTPEHLREYLAIGAQPLPQELLDGFRDCFAQTEEKLVNPSLWN